MSITFLVYVNVNHHQTVLHETSCPGQKRNVNNCISIDYGKVLNCIWHLVFWYYFEKNLRWGFRLELPFDCSS